MTLSNAAHKSANRNEIYSFPPVGDPESLTLILGSIPGKASLSAHEYYAHPRNAFWKIIASLTGAEPGLPYASRVAMPASGKIALWDVLKSCTRNSSLDADIVPSSITENDFLSFYRSHPKIARVFFNGAHAEASYRKHVLPALGGEFEHIAYRRLPSTSPANASLTFEQKLTAWRTALEPAEGKLLQLFD